MPVSFNLTWQPSTAATSYEYCIDTTAGTTCDTSWVSTGMQTTVALSALNFATTYYWQVRAVNAAGTTEANSGTWWNVTTFSAAFNKSQPLNGATHLQVTGLGLSWFSSNGATSYEYCLDTTPGTTCDTSWVSTGTQNFVSLPTLSFETTYYWHVRVLNAAGTTESNGGTWWSFSTVSPAFTKSTPSNGSTGHPVTGVQLVWNPSPGAMSYEYCVDSIPGTTCDTSWVSTGTQNFVTLPALNFQTTYYWQVRAFNLAGTTEADGGTWYTFSTRVAPPAAFGKTGPADGTPGLSRSVLVSWDASAGASGYEYCVDAVNNSTCDTDWHLTDTNTSTTLIHLVIGTTYYWQIRASNTSGTTSADGGTWWSFTVTNFIVNGSFNSGIQEWLTFGAPTTSDIVWNIVNGVFQFYRTGTQATVFQQTNSALGAGVSVRARFDLGNSSSVRKRVSVLILDGDFSDLSVCTFWLPPNSALTTYEMATHPTKPWVNTAIYFYGASTGSNGGHYLLDNVSMGLDPGQPNDRTDCVDPTAPPATGEPASTELLTNGDFTSGALTPWFTFGQIVHQIVGGVFEFYRPFGTPSGVVVQQSGDPIAANGILTATLDLGNSSAVRKRVTVLLHDADFSDLSACTFWLPPGTPLSTFGIRTFATKPWSNATVSVYPSTAGLDQWIRLDNVSLRRTPGTAIVGTECLEPGSSIVAPEPIAATPASPAVAGARDLVTATTTSDVQRLMLPPIHLSADGPAARLTFDAWFEASSSATVEISLDGTTWETIATSPVTSHWGRFDVDLSPWAGRIIYIRIVSLPSGRPEG
jgi:hypothetical protein